MFEMTSGADWLIAGLGNPEPKYDGTRHNAGFEALDYLAAQWQCDIAKAKWQGLYGTALVNGHKVVLLKPLTYMNLSGQSIAPAANFYKIPADHIIVLCDDITQEPGHLRIRPHGSAGGHNGLKSIIASLAQTISAVSASASAPNRTRSTTWPPGCWASCLPQTARP